MVRSVIRVNRSRCDAGNLAVRTRLISLGRVGTTWQWVLRALVQLAYARAVEPFLVDFEIRADQKIRWKLFDRKADGISSAREPFVSHRLPPGLTASRWVQLRFVAVIECGLVIQNSR